MARVAKVSPTSKTMTPARTLGRPPAVVPKPSAKTAKGLVAKPTGGKPGRPPVTEPEAILTKIAKAPPAAKVSKDELRAQVEKLETTVATLRAKSREANKAAKAATARVAELEHLLAQREESAIAPAAEAETAPKLRGRRRKVEIDPGIPAQPGVAAQDSDPVGNEASTALETPLDPD